MCLVYDDIGLDLSSSRIDEGGFPITPPAIFKSDYWLGMNFVHFRRILYKSKKRYE